MLSPSAHATAMLMQEAARASALLPRAPASKRWAAAAPCLPGANPLLWNGPHAGPALGWCVGHNRGQIAGLSQGRKKVDSPIYGR